MPRKPSPKQSQASRENGKRSRGPTSSDAKWRSARRGTKAGLRAQTVALPHEPADARSAATSGIHTMVHAAHHQFI